MSKDLTPDQEHVLQAYHGTSVFGSDRSGNMLTLVSLGFLAALAFLVFLGDLSDPTPSGLAGFIAITVAPMVLYLVGFTVTRAVKTALPQAREFRAAVTQAITGLPRGLHWATPDGHTVYGAGVPFLTLGVTDVPRSKALVGLALHADTDEPDARVQWVGTADGDGCVQVIAPTQVEALRVGAGLLWEFGVATGGLEHVPTWVGPDQDRAFDVSQVTRDGVIDQSVRIGRRRVRPQVPPRQVQVKAYDPWLEATLVAALWPTWAVEHWQIADGPERARREREARREEMAAERARAARAEAAVARVGRRAAPGVADLLDELGRGR